jgi:hypothetical protein
MSIIGASASSISADAAATAAAAERGTFVAENIMLSLPTVGWLTVRARQVSEEGEGCEKVSRVKVERDSVQSLIIAVLNTHPSLMETAYAILRQHR